MPVDKAYAIPDDAIPSIDEEEVELEDNLVAQDGDVEIVEDDDGGVTVDFAPGEDVDAGNLEHFDNLAEVVSDDVLTELSTDLMEAYEKDHDSRKQWLETYKKGLDQLGVGFEERTDPFPGAAGVHHPLLAESVTQFQAQAYKEMLPAEGPVSSRVMGSETPELVDQANRVSDFMNYQITEVMEEFDPDLDQMLYYLPLAGSAFKKTYYDETKGRPVSKFVNAEDLVVNYGSTSLLSADRITHVVTMSGNDIRKNQYTGFYRDTELEASELEASDVQKRTDELQGLSPVVFEGDESYELLEFHVNLDLEGFEHESEEGELTGIALPYIVTIEKDSESVLAVRRNWAEADSFSKRLEFFSHFKFTSGLGFYGFGLVHMIGGLSKSVTSILRQLIDAGTFANLPGGFKMKGMRVEGADEPMAPGEWRDTDVPGGNLRDAFMPLPYKEPSAVLMTLLGALTETGQRFASIADVQVGDTAGQQQPVGTTVAMLERGTKVMSAIHKRMHYAQKLEFKILARVIKESMPPQYPYMIAGADKMVMQTDFDDRVDVIPVSDPNIFSMAQRIILAQQQLQMASQAPEIHNLRAAYVSMYKAMGISNVDALLVPEDKPQAMTPALEHARVLENKKLMAMQDQNHQAHIEAHILFVQNPAVSQNPEFYANVVQDVMQHIGFLAQSQVQGMQQQGMQQQALPQGMQQPAQLPQGFANGGMAQLPQGMPQQGIPQGPSVEEIEAKLIAEILPRLAPPQQEDPLVQLQGSQIEMQRENNSLDYQAALAKIESSENIASAKISADLIKDDQKAEIAVAKESLNHLERQEDRQMQAQQQFNQQGAM